MLSSNNNSPRNSVTHNLQAKLAVDYNELVKELSSHEMTSVGCYTIGETIGEGTFGKVKKGTHKLTGKHVAIKKISKQHAPMMAREIHHHKQLKHPNIVMLYEMITTENNIHIISEYCPNGDLLDVLTESGGRCSEIRVNRWFRQLADAIKYCHMHSIVHRDLKLENILLDADDNVKICDFGFARFAQKNQYLETFCGSLSYSAPEVILRKKYTGPETDIWSLGVILYTLLAGEFPFDDDSEVMTQRKIVQAQYEMPFYFSSDLADLIQNTLQLNPSERLSMDAILDHPWTTTNHDSSDEEETCTTPQQHPSDIAINTIPFLDESDYFSHHQTDFKTPFSPQVRSSLGMLPSKPSRFSAPTPRRRPSHNASFRSSLPSSFGDTATTHMTVMEQQLFAALTAAGFDRDALMKMQTGQCDTSSTLWRLLLENMSSPLTHSVPDAFASALETRSNRAVDQAVQTTDPITAYPKPTPIQQHIQTVGFGPSVERQQTTGWFTSVKSWFGAPKQQQQTPKRTMPDCPIDIMSPPIYRTGSAHQKHRRRALQLNEPVVAIEGRVDQLSYNTAQPMVETKSSVRPSLVETTIRMPPPTATSLQTDTLSILTQEQAVQELDMCSALYRHQPPLSPPTSITTVHTDEKPVVSSSLPKQVSVITTAIPTKNENAVCIKREREKK
ncbi:MAG: kinase-like domain-containing protein [Benjaminiella poitrasii]|nr:MAG: kinase-like domain-containing protein [Benjaminiella poitrasii]